MGTVLFIIGDAGGVRILAPVVEKMLGKGKAEITIVAEDSPIAKADEAWQESGLLDQPEVVYSCIQPWDFQVFYSDYDVVAVGSCGKVNKLEHSAIDTLMAIRGLPDIPRSVIMSDGFYNHRHLAFVDLKPDYWLAINRAHQTDIMEVHKMSDEQVPITGNSQFDELVPV